MRGIKNITKKILDDAKTISKKTHAEGMQKSKAIRDEINERLINKKSNALNKNEKSAENYLLKELAKIRQSSRIEISKIKEDEIESIISELAKELQKKANYEKYLVKIFTDLEKAGSLTVQCNKDSKEIVNAALKKSGIKAKIEVVEISGGVIIFDKQNRKMNHLIDTYIERNIEHIREDILKRIEE